MNDAGVGWIAAFHHRRDCKLAGKVIWKSNMGLMMNILLGIVGAAIASAFFRWHGVVISSELHVFQSFSAAT